MKPSKSQFRAASEALRVAAVGHQSYADAVRNGELEPTMCSVGEAEFSAKSCEAVAAWLEREPDATGLPQEQTLCRIADAAERSVKALERIASAFRDEGNLDSYGLQVDVNWLPEDVVSSALTIAKAVDDVTGNVGVRVAVTEVPPRSFSG